MIELLSDVFHALFLLCGILFALFIGLFLFTMIVHLWRKGR